MIVDEIAMATKPVDWMYSENLDKQSHAYVERIANTAIRKKEFGDAKPAPTAKMGLEATRYIQGFVARYTRDPLMLSILAVVEDSMSMVKVTLCDHTMLCKGECSASKDRVFSFTGSEIEDYGRGVMIERMKM